MDHAQEDGLWRALGACEGEINAVNDELDRMQRQIASIRLHDRLAFVLVLIAGLVIGFATSVSQMLRTEVAEAAQRAVYRCPGPYGVTPRPFGTEGGV